MASIVESLFKGRDASSSVSAFTEAVVSDSEDTWCLGKGHTDLDPVPLMLGQHGPHQ